MTGRERVVAAARGGEVDCRPVIALDGSLPADARVIDLSELESARGQDDAILVCVPSPLARALASGEDIYARLNQDPVSGERVLEELSVQVRADAAEALNGGADGICYRLVGATPAHSTPMQYGGHFLELDRALLEEVAEARFNLLLVEGDEEPYLDFVSDLSAHAFGWSAASGVSVRYMQSMRPGALAVHAGLADADQAQFELKGTLPALVQPQGALR